MRIGISTSVIQRGKTGIAQYLFGLLRALKRCAHEHELTLFVLEQDIPLFSQITGTKIITVPEKFRSPVRDILWHQIELPALARKHKLDVLHIPSYRRMLWPKPCPTVATIHDLAPFHVAEKYDWKRMFYGRVVVKRLAHRQDEIIAISQNTARDITRFFGVAPDKITVIHNGLEHDRFFPDSVSAAKRAVANKHGISAPFFLYVARLEHPAKNHVRLIEAFNRFKAETKSPWNLVFGGSDWHGAEEIHRKASTSPFARDIRSLGFVSNADLPTLYRAADVFVYPSLFEGFGLPPVEAMACGCPVISSNRGSLSEVVGSAARIIDPEDIEQLQAEMARVALNPELRQSLREAGLVHAQLFTWQSTAQQTLQVYERVTQANAKRHAKRLPANELMKGATRQKKIEPVVSSVSEH